VGGIEGGETNDLILGLDILEGQNSTFVAAAAESICYLWMNVKAEESWNCETGRWIVKQTKFG